MVLNTMVQSEMRINTFVTILQVHFFPFKVRSLSILRDRPNALSGRLNFQSTNMVKTLLFLVFLFGALRDSKDLFLFMAVYFLIGIFFKY